VTSSSPSSLAARHTLAADRLTLGYDDEPIVRSLSLDFPGTGITMIVGPNGCGKSTLLRGMARLMRPREGAVLLDGVAVHEQQTRLVARTLGLLPQSPIAPDGLTVSELVARGRHPHRGWLGQRTARDDEAVALALEQTGLVDLATRPVDALSGGQRQRAWIAMALAQEPDILLLDEPTTYLDIAHQVDLLDLLVDLARDRGTAIVVVLHEINLATRYADHLVAMRAGRVVAAGVPGEIVTPELMRDVFAIDALVVEDPVSGTPLVVPYGRGRAVGPATSGSASGAALESESAPE